MDFGWSTNAAGRYDAMLVAVTEDFGPQVRAGSGLPGSEFSGSRFYSRKDWLRLGELGLLGLSVPVEYGGGGLGALDTAHLVEAFGAGCADTGLVFGACAHLFACAMALVGFAGEPIRRRLLPAMCRGELIAANAITEPAAGSDVSALAVTATRVTGGYLLAGTKSFVSNGPAADVFVTYASTDPSAGHLGTTGFVVDREADGLLVGAPFEKMGLWSCPAGPVTFDGCFVPDEQVLGAAGQGGAIFQHSMGWERTCLFAGYLGGLDRLLGRCVEHASTRRQFGSRIGEFQSVANRIVEIKLRTESARWLLYRACWGMDRHGGDALDIALAKLAVSEAALAGALDAVRVFGGRGYQSADGIEAALRDAVPSTIFSGTSDVQRMLIARELGL